jgi:hypothetical protein
MNVYIRSHMCIYIYIYMCVCVCVCVHSMRLLFPGLFYEKSEPFLISVTRANAQQKTFLVCLHPHYLSDVNSA